MKDRRVRYSSILIKWFGILLILLLIVIVAFVSAESYKMMLWQTIMGKINEITLINQKVGTIVSYANAVENLFYYDQGTYGYFNDEHIAGIENSEISYELKMDKARIRSQMDNLVSGFDVIMTGDNGLMATSFTDELNLDLGVIRENENLRTSIIEKVESGGFFVTGLYRQELDRSYYVKYHNVFSVRNKTYLGTQFVLIQDSYFEQSYSRLEFDIGTIFLFDASGNLFNIGDHSDEEIGSIREFVLNSDVDHAITDGKLLIKDLSEETGWTVAESISLSTITDMIFVLVRNIIIFSIVALAIGVVMIVFLSKKITRPLRMFNDVIERSSIKQDSTYEDSESSRIIEIDSLYKSFSEMNRHNMELVDKLIQNENEKKVTELNYMRAQINPHFIYNTLFSIRCTIDMDRKKEAIKMIDILNDMLRRTLRFEEETATVGEELLYIHSYVKLLQFGYNKKLVLRIEVSDEVQSLKMLRFILQPIVENAVFHGIQPKNDNGEIAIYGMMSGNELELMVCDNGIGFSTERLEHVMSEEYMEKKGAEHIGIVNVNKRIKNYYGDEYGIKIESEPGIGTTAYYRLPVIDEDKEH